MSKLRGYGSSLKGELSREERGRLIERYAYLVKVLAYRVAGRMPPVHELDDMVSAGTVGLLEAIESYDPAVGVKFETYAKFRIRGAIIDDIRYRDWVPRGVREKIREIDRLRQRLGVELSRVPNDEDLAKALQMNVEQYYEYLVQIQPGGIVFYEDLGVPQSLERSIVEHLEDKKSPQPEVQAFLKQVKTKVITALDALDDDEKLVMSLYYYESLTLKEIAVVMNLTESRISQIHAKALHRLHWKLREFQNNIPETGDEDAAQSGLKT